MKIRNYYAKLFNILGKLEATDHQGKAVAIDQAVAEIISLLMGLNLNNKKLFFIGNGGSAAIASHMTIDFWKNGGIPALCFNDGAQLTCLANDFGYEDVFAKPIGFFARPGDVLISISSSGQSRNILNAVKVGQTAGCVCITLSGFSPQNPLRKMGRYNIYCDSMEYGFVELAHQIILHMILDLMSENEA